jgi:hypothetical protein
MSTQIIPTTELQAVNIMLSAIGESPVNSITSTTNVDVSVAKNILNETSMSVQTMGWNFNTIYNKATTLDNNNKIPLASNTIQVDANITNFRYMNLTYRNGYLYDMDNDTDVFTIAPSVDIVTAEQFESLPEYARRYITTKAARRFAARFVGAGELVKMAEQDENEAYVAFQQADSRNADLNILENDTNTNNIINRTPRRTY